MTNVGAQFRVDEDEYYYDYFFCYVYLDNDTDITNGYIKRQDIEIMKTCDSVAYEMDTEKVPEGSYYLLAGYDYDEKAKDATPDDLLAWESKGWYGRQR